MTSNKGILSYLHDRIWNVRLEERNKASAFFFKQLRIVLIVTKNYAKDNLTVQAAGLTYWTLLSVVPLVALAFAVAKGFGFQSTLEQEISGALSGHQEVADQIMTFANRMLENTQGGLLAGIGVVVLLWTVLRLLANIEIAFNEIWKVAKGRSWFRRFTEYFSLMLLAPIIVILAASITVVITTEIENLVAGYDFLQAIGPAIHFGIKLIPYTLIWLLFTFVYMIMPNTKVSFKSAFIAGVIAGTAFQLLEWGYINFQVGVSKYNAIYGSFAALPLFLIWANLSWLITLIGAEIAFANQYVTQIEDEIDGDRLSTYQRHVLALIILRRIEEGFEHEEAPLTSRLLSGELGLPYGVTASMLDLLVEAKLLSEVEVQRQDEEAYLPLKNLEKLKTSDVFRAIDQVGHTDIPSIANSELQAFFSRYEAYRKGMRSMQEDILLTQLPELTKASHSA